MDGPLEVEHPQTHQVDGSQCQHRRLVDLKHLEFEERNVKDEFAKESMALFGVDEIGEDLEETARTWELQVEVDAYQGLRFQFLDQIGFNRLGNLQQAEGLRDLDELRHLTEELSRRLIDVLELAGDQKSCQTQALNVRVLYVFVHDHVVDDVHANMQRLLLQALDGIVHLGDPVDEVSSVQI